MKHVGSWLNSSMKNMRIKDGSICPEAVFHVVGPYFVL